MNRKQRKRKWEAPVGVALPVDTSSLTEIQVNPLTSLNRPKKLAEVAMPAYGAGSMASLVGGFAGADRLSLRAAGAFSARGLLLARRKA